MKCHMVEVAWHHKQMYDHIKLSESLRCNISDVPAEAVNKGFDALLPITFELLFRLRLSSPDPRWSPGMTLLLIILVLGELKVWVDTLSTCARR